MDASMLIAVPTYRRPEQIRYLLERLSERGNAIPVTVLVADSDAEQRKDEAVVRAMACILARRGRDITIDMICVDEKGLCHVRNTLLQHALRHDTFAHLAMIDDGEWPDKGGLAEPLRVQASLDADIVGGTVAAILETETATWVHQPSLFQPETRPEGACPMIWGANNVLLTRACIERSGPLWFDAAFNRTGGADIEFFTRIRDEGNRFAWAPKALVFERIPAKRTEASWFLRRALRIGPTDGRIRMRRASAPSVSLPSAAWPSWRRRPTS